MLCVCDGVDSDGVGVGGGGNFVGGGGDDGGVDCGLYISRMT